MSLNFSCISLSLVIHVSMCVICLSRTTYPQILRWNCKALVFISWLTHLKIGKRTLEKCLKRFGNSQSIQNVLLETQGIKHQLSFTMGVSVSDTYTAAQTLLLKFLGHLKSFLKYL